MDSPGISYCLYSHAPAGLNNAITQFPPLHGLWLSTLADTVPIKLVVSDFIRPGDSQVPELKAS